MRDAIDDRVWSDGHNRFSRDLAVFLGRIGDGFARLNRIQWSAPWNQRDRPPSVRGPAQA
jgi:hypothetical protein